MKQTLYYWKKFFLILGAPVVTDVSIIYQLSCQQAFFETLMIFKALD